MLADLDYILDDCPFRYFASGVADAMAKYPGFVLLLYVWERREKFPQVVVGVMISTYLSAVFEVRNLGGERFKEKKRIQNC